MIIQLFRCESSAKHLHTSMAMWLRCYWQLNLLLLRNNMKTLLTSLFATFTLNAVAEPIEYVITGETQYGDTTISVNFDDQDFGIIESSPNYFAVPNGSAILTVSGNSYEFSNLNLSFVQGADWTGFMLRAQADDGTNIEFNSGAPGYSLLNAVPTTFSPVSVELDGGWMSTSSPNPELSTSF